MHVWPKGRRRAVLGVPPLHAHEFDLMAFIAGGAFHDNFYDVEFRGTAEQAAQFLGLDHPLLSEQLVGNDDPSSWRRVAGRIYHRRTDLPVTTAAAHFSHAIQVSDVVTDTTEWAVARHTSSFRNMTLGGAHGLRAGSFHVSPIPINRFCATLCFRQPVETECDYFIGRPDFARDRLLSGTFARPALTFDELQMVMDQLADFVPDSLADPLCLPGLYRPSP